MNLQEERMNKPVFAMLLGGFLGIFDGLTALISGGPEVPAMIGTIVAGSTFKGVMAGLIVGLVAQRTRSMAIIVGVGLMVGALFAYLVTLGGPYFWEIILPGSIVGLVVGFATAKYRGPAVSSSRS
jgi:hypothetical protein